MSDVLPAQAGMIRSCGGGRRWAGSAPRAGGDDPTGTFSGTTPRTCSPRRRG